MGAKKKVDVQQPPPQPQQKVMPNVFTLRTSDLIDFKLSEELISKYSPRLKALSEASKDDLIILDEVNSRVFQVVFEYLNMHKQKEPSKIITPIKTNQNLRYIMEQSDADLIQKVIQKGDDFTLQMMDVASYLEIESLRRRLACGVAIKLMKTSLEELKQLYDLQKQNANEDELKGEMRTYIDNLKMIPDEEQ